MEEKTNASASDARELDPSPALSRRELSPPRHFALTRCESLKASPFHLPAAFAGLLLILRWKLQRVAQDAVDDRSPVDVGSRMRRADHLLEPLAPVLGHTPLPARASTTVWMSGC